MDNKKPQYHAPYNFVSIKNEPYYLKRDVISHSDMDTKYISGYIDYRINTINEIKNTLDGINSRITEAEERISDLEDKMVEITTTEQDKEKRMKRTEDSLRDLWDNIKRANIRIIGVPEEEERKKGPEKIFEEIIIVNFPNMGKEIAKSRKRSESHTG